MSDTKKDEINSLVKQLNDQVSNFNTRDAESDRLATIQTAQDLVQKLQTPQESVTNIVYSPTHFLCIRIGIDLDVFNTLVSKNGPVSLNEVASVKGADPILVERVLRILAAIRYINDDGPRLYSTNDMTIKMTGRLEVAKVKFIWLGAPTLVKIPEFLQQIGYKNPEGAVGGPFNYAEDFPESLWVWVGQDQERLDICNTFMESDRGSRPSWLEWFPVKERVIDGFDHTVSDTLLVDAAGGRGHDIQAFHKKFPDAPGRLIVEDQPHVIEDIRDLDLSIERVGFDLFDRQPVKDARTYYLKFILHDWNDEDCRKILHNIASVMRKGYSKLIIEEFILADTGCAMLPAMWDWEMMVFCNSMECTQGQWQRLLKSAGFDMIRFWNPPGDGQGIIEAEFEERPRTSEVSYGAKL